ncbi:PLP-dependent aminotransferase family protein [Acidovorax sp. SUPP2522]|uniref:aminotransferase-like domain-containing protein n=1 Tax=unclassified Acidovorax TaxID=2684926 RepID=UPI00234A7A56|nr:MULTISPECIES: PLP-dependent aminotransferase family protein [unclassified Acidovorax]WCM96436.1 PLP-dependent aminotransferase family protein [Acidovorax sp. GBBC 1281]GKT15044.1 PLP-dependent aminotransferase family protein [Acidovorax sp. SUPP2522]
MSRSADPRETTPLYRQLAALYEQAIAAGSLQPGMRMPSVRELCQRHQVSLTTALQVLRHLESQGSVEARERVGYFVREPGGMALPGAREPELLEPLPDDPSVFAGINERISMFLEKARRAGPVPLDLGSAMPAPSLFDARALNRLAQSLLREQPDILVYGPSAPTTHVEFQQAMARHALTFGVCLAPSDIGATHGNSEAVTLALDAIAEPGDVIAVESPTFFGILQAIQVRGLKALEIPCSPHTGISLEALELAARNEPRLKGVVVVPHLQMPQGSVMPDVHKERLVALCVEYGLALVEDDIYREFVESPRALRPAKAWDKVGDAGQVIYCASLSKSFAPGLRQGWMSAGRWQARVQMLKFARTRNMQTWSQLLAARSVDSPAYERHMRRMRTQLRVQREHAARAVARYFPVGTRLSLPPGGISLWLELPPDISTTRLYDQALQCGIRIAPGPMFSNTGRYENFLRLSCGMPFTPEVEEAYRTLGTLMAQQRAEPALRRAA